MTENPLMRVGGTTPYSALAKFDESGLPLPMSDKELAALALRHRDSGRMGSTTAGMAVCQTCSHGPGSGDEAIRHEAFWPCEIARLLATVAARVPELRVTCIHRWSYSNPIHCLTCGEPLSTTQTP